MTGFRVSFSCGSVHENLKTLIELYETGRLSPACPETVYLQGGQLCETKPEPKEGLTIWTEVFPNEFYIQSLNI
jgi:hypothetical protein